LRQVINHFRDQYATAARKDKIRIANQVIDIISGRFLTENLDGTWSEVDKHRVVERKYARHCVKKKNPGRRRKIRCESKQNDCIEAPSQ
jgi:hypothetical protein